MKTANEHAKEIVATVKDRLIDDYATAMLTDAIELVIKNYERDSRERLAERIHADENNKNSADDRGNVVDIYVDGEPTGRLDREADPIPDIDENETLAWDGGKDEIAVAIEHGYGEEVAIAILCSFLRGDTTAREQAIDYLQVAFTAA